jgi:probable F420-dependent oxidoreductase
MRLDRFTYGMPLDAAQNDARMAEQAGLDGWFVGEGKHDPFLLAAMAAEHTRHITVGTAVAIAFARNPMSVAYQAHDLQQLTGGRFCLGLGTQVPAHIVSRYGGTWTAPVDRMREFVAALRAIWAAWRNGTELSFRGAHYRHTLMPPAFRPDAPWPDDPPIYIAGVGPRMVRLAGEVADGLVCHVFNSREYLETVVLPQLRSGAAEADRDAGAVAVAAMVAVVTGTTKAQRQEAREAARRQVAFYASTPAYRPVLDVHGWGRLHEELHALSRQGRWDDMAGHVDDAVLDTFVVYAEDPADVGTAVSSRFGGMADRVLVAPAGDLSAGAWHAMARGARGPEVGPVHGRS